MSTLLVLDGVYMYTHGGESAPTVKCLTHAHNNSPILNAQSGVQWINLQAAVSNIYLAPTIPF